MTTRMRCLWQNRGAPCDTRTVQMFWDAPYFCGKQDAVGFPFRAAPGCSGVLSHLFYQTSRSVEIFICSTVDIVRKGCKFPGSPLVQEVPVRASCVCSINPRLSEPSSMSLGYSLYFANKCIRTFIGYLFVLVLFSRTALYVARVPIRMHEYNNLQRRFAQLEW